MKKILLFVVLLTLSLGCSDDSHSSMVNMGTLTYRATSATGITITSVEYRNANGTMVTETPNSAQWSKNIEIHKPFSADLNVTVNNTQDSVESGVALSALLDGEEIASDTNVVPNGTSEYSLIADVD